MGKIKGRRQVLRRGVLASCPKTLPDASRTRSPEGALVQNLPARRRSGSGPPGPKTLRSRIRWPEGRQTQADPPEGFSTADQVTRRLPDPEPASPKRSRSVEPFHPRMVRFRTVPPEGVPVPGKDARKLPNPGPSDPKASRSRPTDPKVHRPRIRPPEGFPTLDRPARRPFDPKPSSPKGSWLHPVAHPKARYRAP